MLENALLMALYSKEHNVPLKFLKFINGEIRDMSEFLHNDMGRFFTAYKYSVDDTIMLYFHIHKDKDNDQLSNDVIQFLDFINDKNLQSTYSVELINDAKRNFEYRWSSLMEITDKRLEKT